MALWNRRRTIIAVALIVATAAAIAVWTKPQLCTSMAGTPSEIAQTPRDDRRIEQMAIRISKGITADQQTYSRLRSDISAIRTLAPNLSGVQYHPADDGKAALVKLKPLAQLLRAIGLYRQWDCLNEHYGLKSVDSVPQEGTVQVSFKWHV